MKNRPPKRRSPGRRPSTPSVDIAVDTARHARALHGDNADPWAVAGSLFKASFLSLARLAPEDDGRRHALLQRVLERAYDELGER